MLKRELQLTVENPCTESWDQMDPLSQGRHCRQCNKQVIDFTGFSDQELINWFSMRNGPFCGRLSELQVDRVIVAESMARQPMHLPYKWILGIAMGLGIISKSDAGTPSSSKNKIVWQSPDPTAEHTAPVLYLTVIDSITGDPIKDVQLVVYFDSVHKAFFKTDSNGQAFVMWMRGFNEGRRLLISKHCDSLGTEYAPCAVQLTDRETDQLTVSLVPTKRNIQTFEKVGVRFPNSDGIMGALVITQTTKHKLNFWQRLTRPVRRLWWKLRH